MTASTGLVTASTDPSAEKSYTFSKVIRNERLRLSDLCPYAGQAPGGTISGRRPLPRVPWPESITCPLTSDSKIDCASHVLARSLPVQPNPCTEQVPWASPAFQARIGHRTRGREAKTVSLSSRTYSDSDRHAARTARSKTVRANVSRETILNSSFLISRGRSTSH